MKIKTALLAIVACLALVGSLLVGGNASAISYGNVDIIDDQVMNNTGSMSAAQINSFLNSFAGTCIGTNSGFTTPDPQGYSSGAYQFGSNTDAGTAIRDIAVHYDLNPQVLLATLEKEQGLIDRNGNCDYSNPAPAPAGASCDSPSGTGPSYCSYACQNSPQGGCVPIAMGYGCPGYCQNNFLGFSKQISGASWVFRFAEARAEGLMTGYAGYDVGDEDICYSGPMTAGYRQRSDTSATCAGVPGNQSIYYDGSYTDANGDTMNIANGATASMLNYTPFYANSYLPSELFVSKFTQWFGNPAYPPSPVYIPNGTYNIVGNGSGKNVDVSGDSSADGATVQLYNNNGTGAQEWNFTRDSEGYYSIQNVSSGKYLDVSAAGISPGTRVDIWDGNGSCAQEWAIQSIGTNYTFLSTCSGLAMDATDGGTSNGTPIQIYTPNQTPAQEWTLRSLSSPVIANGFYNLLTTAGTALDVPGGSTQSGTQLDIYTNNGTGAQEWQVTRQSNGLYELRNPQSGKYLDVIGASTQFGTPVDIYTGNNTCAQEWAIIDNGGGSYGLVSSCSGLNLDVSGDLVTTNGTGVDVYTSNGTGAQEWTLSKLTSIPDGTYSLLTTAGTALDVPGGSTMNGIRLQIYTRNGTGAQEWQAIKQSNNLYEFRNPQSGKYLDVVGASKSADTPVDIYTGNNTCAQEWAVTSNGDGSYGLTSSCSSLKLDVWGDTVTANGTPVDVYTDNGSGAQEWTLTNPT